MAEVTRIDPINFELQTYEDQDLSLINKFNINSVLTGSSYIEFFVYDLNQNLLSSNFNYNSYSISYDDDNISTIGNDINQFSVNPSEDILNQGFDEGEYVAYYNFLTKQIGDVNTNLFISEISSDRTEIKLDSTVLTSLDIIEQTNNFTQFREDSNYFVDFYLNFSSNNLIIANNIKLEDETTNDPTIIVKLYEPLPSQFDLKDELWIVTTLNEPEAFQVDFPVTPIIFTDSTPLQGPNFNLPIKGEVNNSSQNLSYNDIINNISTSSINQVNSLLEESSINISVDYTDFNDFIHFSSAQTRIENFYYKVGLIETYTSESNVLSNTSGSSTSIAILENKISDITQNFDKFEYFMYYSSGSEISYPKSNSEEPYILYPTTSSQVLTWLGSTDENNSNFGGQLLSASYFDNANPDQLKKAIPEYLREDPDNQQYDLFVDMVAQYYDNVWLYTKDVTQKYNADNRLDFGVSKDLVAEAIRDFGVKLYQNNFSNKDLYTAFLGLTPEGSVFPFPEITGSIPVPTGYEFVDTLISASNDNIPLDDVNKSLYKRIYHNIPYLLKSKGTISGLRALITSYGIPDTILKISEFGGKDQVNANDYDLYFNNFNFALSVGPDLNFVSSSWEAKPLWNAPNDRASTVQLRFKSEKISSNVSPFGITNLSQSLWQIDRSNSTAELLLDYSGSGLDSGSLVNDSGSYNGSIKDPYYQYANLRFIPDNTQPTISASITLPFYNNDWWSVMVTTDQSGTYNLYAGNKIYNGNDGTSIGHYASASVSGASDNRWTGGVTSIFASSSINFNSYKGFSGSLQEIRYYKSQISESVFKDYIMNPLSIEGNNINSASEELIFRAPLGSELDTRLRIPPNTLKSVHPRVTGSLPIRPSFKAPSNSNYYLDNAFAYNNGGTYHTNTETFFLDQPAAGIKNRINDKIRFEDNVVPTGDTLSAFRRITQQTENSASYTDSINYLEAAFSPQNQINDDIIGQMGHFNIGDYIGDPRQRFEGNRYPELNELSEDYFKKYIKQYDLVDFVRLIKFFDNSLFKMIKDFIPVRTSLASGLVVKQHLLERNKYPQPQVSYTNESELTGSITSHQLWDPINEVKYITSSKIVSTEGGPGGVFNSLNLPPREISFSYSNTLSGGLSTTILIKSTIRGTINTPKPLLPLTSRTEVLELYDGENIYIEGQNLSNFPNVNNEFTISISSINSTFEFVTTSSLITFPSQLVDPSPINLFLGTTPTIQSENVIWNSTNGYFNVNYLPTETLYKNDTNTQFWNESFPTVSGSITKLHDNQDEFYDGEFSGSVILVTNGELNEGCDDVKTVSPIGGFYNIRSYQTTTDLIYNNFLNVNNKPLNGYIQTLFLLGVRREIRYIKIANIDSTGKNLVNSIESLTSITLPISSSLPHPTEPDLEEINYKVINRSKFQDYFFLEVSEDPSVKSKLNDIPLNIRSNLEYDFTGSMSTDSIFVSGNGTAFPTFTARSSKVSISSSLNDNLNFFNSSILEYELGTSPQKTLNIVVTGSFNPTMALTYAASYGLYIIPPGNSPDVNGNANVITYTPFFNNSSPNPSPLSLTASVPGENIIPGSKIQLRLISGLNGGQASLYPGTTLIISSSAATSSLQELVIEPYLTRKFQNSDCDVLQGEATEARKNPFLQDLDYQTSQTVPVNYDVVVEGSASRAAVPESYYTSLAQINSRYIGSKNQSTDVNVYRPLGFGGQTTTDFGNPINIGTYGQLPSVESDQVMIYEYEWAGGTTPEILGWGAYKMGKILQVNSPNSIRTINPGDGLKNQTIKAILPSGSLNPSSIGRNTTLNQNVNDFYYTLNGNNPTNTNISFFSYGQSSIGSSSPVNGKVLTTDFGVPTRSNFILTSSKGDPYGYMDVGSNIIELDSTISMSRVRILNGGYAPGDEFSPISLFQSPSESINPQLNDGERWFITLYNSLDTGSGGTIDNNSLSPYNVGFSGSDSNGNYIYPFQAKGVVEILSVSQSLDLDTIYLYTNTTFTENTQIGEGVLGALMWRARAAGKNEFVITQNEVGDNGPGCFINEFTPEYVTQNLEQITKEFGSNKQ